jgi:GntR family transcriptional repressor for pyruvate dehydrogenase complex
MADRLRAEHHSILPAVRCDDGERAAKLVAAHIEGYYREAGVGSGDTVPARP